MRFGLVKVSVWLMIISISGALICFEAASSLTGREPCSPEERRLFSLPTHHGGLNIINPVATAENELAASKQISAPLMEMIINQTDTFTKPQLSTIKSTLNRQKHQLNENAAQEVKEQLPCSLQRAMELANEKGSSIWLTALPLQDQGFNLNKREISWCSEFAVWMATQEYTSTLYLWYILLHWPCNDLPTSRSTHYEAQWYSGHYSQLAQWSVSWCWKRASIIAAGRWGHLTPVNKQTWWCQSRHKGKRFLGTAAKCIFWCEGVPPQRTKLPPHQHPYRRHEQAKKWEYGDRIREVEMASFTPLIFATTAGMGREATASYKRLADGLAAKNNAAYSTTLAWMRCTLSFSLLRTERNRTA